MSIEAVVLRLIARYSRFGPKVVSLTMPLRDAGVDVLSIAQMVAYLEARFAVSIAPEEAAEWATGEQVVRALTRLLHERPREVG